MSNASIINILKDLFADYGEHINLTTSERREIELWLEDKYNEEIKKC